MSKSRAFIIAALAGCLGLIAGVLAMASQVEDYKSEKEEAMVVVKQANETITALSTQLKEYSNAKEKLELELSNLRKQVARSDLPEVKSGTVSSLRESSENKETRMTSGFIYKNVRIYRGKNYLTGELDMYPAMIVGEMTNGSGKNCKMATFCVSVYDRGNRLLAVDRIYMNNFMQGDTKSFSGIISCEHSVIDKYKIDLDDYLE